MVRTGAWDLTSFIGLKEFDPWHLMLEHQPTDVFARIGKLPLMLQ